MARKTRKCGRGEARDIQLRKHRFGYSAALNVHQSWAPSRESSPFLPPSVVPRRRAHTHSSSISSPFFGSDCRASFCHLPTDENVYFWRESAKKTGGRKKREKTGRGGQVVGSDRGKDEIECNSLFPRALPLILRKNPLCFLSFHLVQIYIHEYENKVRTFEHVIWVRYVNFSLLLSLVLSFTLVVWASFSIPRCHSCCHSCCPPLRITHSLFVKFFKAASFAAFLKIFG